MALLFHLFCRVSEVATFCLAKALTSLLYVCCLPTVYASVQGFRRKHTISSSASCDNGSLPCFSLVMLTADPHRIMKSHVNVDSVVFKFLGPSRHTKYLSPVMKRS